MQSSDKTIDDQDDDELIAIGPSHRAKDEYRELQRSMTENRSQA
jgi:hypothetical protein